VLGRFITFEGGEGSGKTTQIERLARVVQGWGRGVVVTREPGGTDLGRALRDLILGHAYRPVPLAELLMLLADRAQHVDEVVRPALAAGKVVLSDRFTDATLAYQVAGRGLDAPWVREAVRAAAGSLVPDLTLLLDVPVETGNDRVQGRGRSDRLDAESATFHRAVREAYERLRVAEPGRMRRIDASLDPEAVHRRILEIVESVIERPR
jgi:dTMP kinase